MPHTKTHIEPGWHDARRIAYAHAAALSAERVALADADHRTLATDIAARTPLPHDDNSAMDGWAVSGPGPWRVGGEVLAGQEPGEQLSDGTACVIATGGVMPVGADAVVRREHGVLTDGVLTADVIVGAEIRRRGEECAAGDLLATAGDRVTPGLVGLLAATGYDQVEVVRRPRVTVLSIGDELLTSGQPRTGMIRDSLGPQLPMWLVRLGAEAAGVVMVPDTLTDLEAALIRGHDEGDITITTGSTAAGPVDHLHPALSAVGATVVIDTVAVRPGYHMLLARWDSADRTHWILGLPGNPLSAVASLLTLGDPLIASLLGTRLPELPTVTLTEQTRANPTQSRMVVGTAVGGRFTAAAALGSAMLSGLAHSTGFAVVPAGGAAEGAAVPWLPLP